MSIIYADDILFQGNDLNNVQLALNNFTTLQAFKALACCVCVGGGGIPILNMVYLKTIRSIIDYAALLGKGRIRKIEVMQNEAMKVILG